MPGLDPGIHRFSQKIFLRDGLPGQAPAMTGDPSRELLEPDYLTVTDNFSDRKSD
jgi:hypothetical protein